MGAAWRSPNDRQVDEVAEAVHAVADLGMETCVTLGMLTESQPRRWPMLDSTTTTTTSTPPPTSTARSSRAHLSGPSRHARGLPRGRYQPLLGRDRGHGRERDGSGRAVAATGDLEPASRERSDQLLIQVPGTPLHGLPEFEPLELVRTIAAARIVMPESTIRLSAGRSSMSEETHALCLHAGASSIFLGDRLLTADNNGDDADAAILDQLDVSVRPLDRRVSIES